MICTWNNLRLHDSRSFSFSLHRCLEQPLDVHRTRHRLPDVLVRDAANSSRCRQVLTLTLISGLHSFKASRTYEPIHTGGKVALSGDGTWLVSTLNEQALVSQVETGERVQLLKGVSSS